MNRWAVGDDWTLASETVEPDRVLCLGDNPCPSLNRRYRVEAPLTRRELGFLAVCSAGGRAGGFVVRLRQDATPRRRDGAVVQVLVRPTAP